MLEIGVKQTLGGLCYIEIRHNNVLVWDTRIMLLVLVSTQTLIDDFELLTFKLSYMYITTYVWSFSKSLLGHSKNQCVSTLNTCTIM